MVFSSMSFLFAFLPLVLILYYVSPMKVKNIILLTSGIIFYAWGEPIYVLVMLLSVLVDYSAGLMMEKYDNNKKVRLACLICSLVINIGLLSIFKYSSFIVNNINAFFGTAIPDPDLPLPVGISFFTFQSMSYTIDLYMRKISVQRNIVSFTSYVTLFPQIVAGPIVRYIDVAKEIDSREIKYDMVASGIGIFIKGLAKKVLLANNIGAVWVTVKAIEATNLSPLTAWIGILAFTFQIYYDFSGYSDMAIGLGKMLGFNFPINFDHPYTSKSISEFWRRWHITLGSWFRSYVYIPLGGNRCSKPRLFRNLLITWFLTGLWHGASWNFVLWGLYFGALIILERFVLGKYLKNLPDFFQWLYSFVLVVFGWVFFEMSSLEKIGLFFKAMFGLNGAPFANQQSVYLLASNIVMFVLCAVGSTNLLKRLVRPALKRSPNAMGTVKVLCEILLFAVCICYLVTSAYNPFLYFNF